MDSKNQIIEVKRNGDWVLAQMEDLKPGENFRIKSLRKEMRYKACVHGSKESNYIKAREWGKDNDDDFMRKFVYSLMEVELDMKVDTETGESWIIGIKGTALESPIKA